jgi:hypothetical protein
MPYKQCSSTWDMQKHPAGYANLKNIYCLYKLFRPRGTPYKQKLALTSPTSVGRSVGIVCSRTQAIQFSFFNVILYLIYFFVVNYRLCIIWIIHQQLWGYKVEENYIWGYAIKKGWIPLLIRHQKLRQLFAPRCAVPHPDLRLILPENKIYHEFHILHGYFRALSYVVDSKPCFLRSFC